jgi:hypothetical protein
MFTTLAFCAMAILAWMAQRGNGKERKAPFGFDDDLVRQSVVFVREDVRVVAAPLSP